MARNKPRIAVEVVERGDTKYEVVVDLEDGHYYGRWLCLANGQTGDSSAMCDTIDEAKRAAIINLDRDRSFTADRKRE